MFFFISLTVKKFFFNDKVLCTNLPMNSEQSSLVKLSLPYLLNSCSFVEERANVNCNINDLLPNSVEDCRNLLRNIILSSKDGRHANEAEATLFRRPEYCPNFNDNDIVQTVCRTNRTKYILYATSTVVSASRHTTSYSK